MSQRIKDKVWGLQVCLAPYTNFQSIEEAASLFLSPNFTQIPLVTLTQNHTGKVIQLNVVPT